jgi:hypothetical protein
MTEDVVVHNRSRSQLRNDRETKKPRLSRGFSIQ